MENKVNVGPEKFLRCCKEFRCALSEVVPGAIIQMPINGTGGNARYVSKNGYFPCPERKNHAMVLRVLDCLN